MKKANLLFVFIMFRCFVCNSQIVLNEAFTNSWSPSGSGWLIQNNSSPIGTGTWFQGAATTFSAYSGGPNDYYACNYTSQGNTVGGISNFLITPTLSLVNGAILKFATRTATATNIYPDRMQVLMSQSSGTGAINSGTTSVGTFTTLLADINSSLTTTGYPLVWTVYTQTITGITGTVTGRFAFRYFVEDGGINGNNSNFIGIDEVTYTLPCATPTIVINPASANICSGNTATLFGSGATTYTWSTGATTPSIVVFPTASTVYSLTGSSTPGCNITKTVAVTVTLTPNVAISNVTTCAGTSVILSASGATSYSWNTGATTAAISNTGTPATYTVTGNNGICVNTKTVSVSVGSNLSVGLVGSTSSVCAGSSVTLTASGPATSYSWLPSGSGASNVISPTTGVTYTVTGLNGSCFGTNTIAITVNALPIVSVTLSSGTNTICSNQGTITTTASGALTYTWSPFISNNSIVTVTTPSLAGTYSLGVKGTDSQGCSNNYSVSLHVVFCSGVEENVFWDKNLKAYPNPFNERITISGISGLVEIMDVHGQIQISLTVKEFHIINTSCLPSGVYFLRFKDYSAERIVTKKIVKE
ncbi:MAG: choice-of-anchor J domain-containing protein [Bacteroidota bacterium]|nr:choice-of-anchor J domain-containing protein [Bacteroidota bacterium]